MHHPRSVLTGVVALAALVSVAPASATPLTDARADGCATSMTFLVWPHGHPAIPAIGFGDMTTPHMEIYKPGSTYPNSNFLGSLTAQGSASVVSSCHRVSGTSGSSKIDKSKAKSTGSATALTCKSKTKPIFEFSTLAGGGVRLRVFLGQTAEMVTNIRAQGSSLKYDKTHCRAASPPS